MADGFIFRNGCLPGLEIFSHVPLFSAALNYCHSWRIFSFSNPLQLRASSLLIKPRLPHLSVLKCIRSTCSVKESAISLVLKIPSLGSAVQVAQALLFQPPSSSCSPCSSFRELPTNRLFSTFPASAQLFSHGSASSPSLNFSNEDSTVQSACHSSLILNCPASAYLLIQGCHPSHLQFSCSVTAPPSAPACFALQYVLHVLKFVCVQH